MKVQILCLVCALLCVYIGDVKANQHRSTFVRPKPKNISPNQLHSLVLDAHQKVKLSWMVDWSSEEVMFSIKNGISSHYSWFMMGFSRRGEFPRTDLCIFQQENDLMDIVVDARSSDDGSQILIDEQQDCINIARTKSDEIAFRRKFDTCDSEDFPIHEGTMYVYWMRGKEPLDLSSTIFKKPEVNLNDTGTSFVQLLRADALTIPEKNYKKAEIRVTNLTIPSKDTTYWCKVQKLQDIEHKKHIVEFEPIVTSEMFVHHMEIFHCDVGSHIQIPLYEGDCDFLPVEAKVCAKVMALWAMGAQTFTYPKEAGMPMGGEGYNPYVRLEVHYNNPQEIAGKRDSSGMRIKYTEHLRKFDAAVMELGLEYSDKMAIPPNQTAFPLSGYCIAECTNVALPRKGITVFGSQLHTHLRGVRVLTRHFRDGYELVELNRDDFYSHHYQDMRILRRKPKVLPGDALVTTCYYDTQGYQNATMGGFSIQDEMCVNYIHYYPATKLEVCKSTVSEKTLAEYFQYMKDKEHQSISEEKGRFESYRSIKWTTPRINELYGMYTEEPLSMQCNKSDGQRFDGFEWEGAPITEVPVELPVVKGSCLNAVESLHSGKCDLLGDCIY